MTRPTRSTTRPPRATRATRPSEPKDNHGAYVSAVAHDHTLTGREHGKAVSEVARSDAGKPNADDEDAEDTDGPGQGKGNGNGKGHGKP